MATIDNKQIIDELIANDGHYEDDPEVALIVEYTNAFDKVTYGVTWLNKSQQLRYLFETEFVRNPKIIWKNRKLN